MSPSTKEGIEIWRLLNKLLLEQVVRKINIFGDNKTSLILIRDIESQNPTKQIDTIYHFIWGLVEDRELGIK